MAILLFAAFTVTFDFLPRSTFSELEKRDLKTFPEFSWKSFSDGSFTEGINSWFSDTEPFRDFFSSISMSVKGMQKLNIGGDDQVSFVEDDGEGNANVFGIAEEEPVENRTLTEYTNTITADDTVKIGHYGIIIAGSGEKARALMAFKANEKAGTCYSDIANKYKDTFGDSVNVYCLVIPTAVEFYCPDKARSRILPQWPVINNIFSHLNENVKAVDAYTPLSQHVDEDIYLRTDHHWSPRGAYYAAREIARMAGVPFKDFSSYEEHVAHGYVGSMYGYTHDITVKKAAEDFIYWTPVGVEYTTTYINYSLDKEFHVTGEYGPTEGEYFQSQLVKDGSGGCYCVFMGGDSKITQVRTSTANDRRILILKDSFGNAIPGWLFFSFEEVHVIDFRYFTKNMVKYVKDNGITDIVFANNIFNAVTPGIANSYDKFLRQ